MNHLKRNDYYYCFFLYNRLDFSAFFGFSDTGATEGSGFVVDLAPLSINASLRVLYGFECVVTEAGAFTFD